MNIIFQKAKNGEDTALVENLYLHSAYNPQKEADRFVENLQPPFQPEIIIITEPALSYVALPLKNKFPTCKIACIRYVADFEKYNKDFDFVLNFFENPRDFANELLQKLGEERLLTTFFCSWEPSSKVFSEQNKKVWQAIKKAIENAKTLLITRQYFEKKWLINSFIFFSYLKNPLKLTRKIRHPIFIIASGRSLETYLQAIKEIQGKVFIICLSSAIKACLENGIKPDLCLSTDGGYWAGQHLKILASKNIPLALVSESYCPKKILKNNDILPLKYGDEVIKIENSDFLLAKRNGTISGTALEFALDYSESESEIFFFGLDLASQKGFQHCQINELEINAAIKDNRIKNDQTRATRSQFSTASFEIYKNWFKNFNLKERKVYRVINEEFKHNSLGQIKDISGDDFNDLISQFQKNENKDYLETNPRQGGKMAEKVKKSLSSFLQNDFFTEKTKKQLYPLEYILLKHEPDNKEIKNRIEKNHNDLYEKLRGIIDG